MLEALTTSSNLGRFVLYAILCGILASVTLTFLCHYWDAREL